MSLAELLAAGPVVLDGGLSTELEARGSDLSSALWSARLLRDDPGAIEDVHRAFAEAGAQVLTTASYQASVEGFAAFGIVEADARELIARSVRLARSAGGDGDGGFGEVVVAGSAGPYGAMLADGSEYTGDYGPDVGSSQLRAFHRRQLSILADAGVDVLACETIPSLLEASVVIEELERLGVPGWVSLTTVTSPDGSVRTRSGELASEAWSLARDASSVVAVGVNCTASEGISDAVRVAAAASGKPVAVYPNSGEGWDAALRRWTDAPAGGLFTAAQVQDWVDGGARLIGGCCRVSPSSIASLATLLRQSAPTPQQ